jgi:tripartite-type tricarboxylate transporter receptor subunit TctC
MNSKVSRRSLIAGAAALAVPAVWPRGARANWRPTKTIRIIVPNAAGGTTDAVGRVLASHLRNVWGQTAVVENRSGGGGTIGASEVARADDDGHTILVGNPGPNAIAYSIYRNLNYRPDQFRPAGGIMRNPNIVTAHPKTGIKSIPELIAYARANPDKLNYGSTGVGQSTHLAAAWFLQLTGLKIQHIPYRGSGMGLPAALAGDVEVFFDNLFPSLSQVRDGKLTALAVTTHDRNDEASNVPAMRETSPELKDFDISSWYGVFYPRSTSDAIVEALNAEVKALLQKDEAKNMIRSIGGRPIYSTPAEFQQFVDGETTKFKGIIEREGLQLNIN